LKKKTKQQSPPEPDRVPGVIKYRPPKGKKSERPLERIRNSAPKR